MQIFVLISFALLISCYGMQIIRPTNKINFKNYLADKSCSHRSKFYVAKALSDRYGIQPELPSIPECISDKFEVENSIGPGWTSFTTWYNLWDPVPIEEDVNQRFLANCAMMASFSSIAALRPEVLTGAIEDKSRAFHVRLIWNGRKVIVPVDKSFPRPFFARNRDPSKTGCKVELCASPRCSTNNCKDILWPLIMEKAFAILMKSGYNGLIGISSKIVMESILGQKYENYVRFKDLKERKQMWKRLVDDKIPAVLCVPTNYQTFEPHRLKDNLIINDIDDQEMSLHCYGLLGYEQTSEDFNIIIRNPHSNTERFKMTLEEVDKFVSYITIPEYMCVATGQNEHLKFIDQVQNFYLNYYMK